MQHDFKNKINNQNKQDLKNFNNIIDELNNKSENNNINNSKYFNKQEDSSFSKHSINKFNASKEMFLTKEFSAEKIKKDSRDLLNSYNSKRANLNRNYEPSENYNINNDNNNSNYNNKQNSKNLTNNQIQNQEKNFYIKNNSYSNPLLDRQEKDIIGQKTLNLKFPKHTDLQPSRYKKPNLSSTSVNSFNEPIEITYNKNNLNNKYQTTAITKKNQAKYNYNDTNYDDEYNEDPSSLLNNQAGQRKQLKKTKQKRAADKIIDESLYKEEKLPVKKLTAATANKKLIMKKQEIYPSISSDNNKAHVSPGVIKTVAPDCLKRSFVDSNKSKATQK